MATTTPKIYVACLVTPTNRELEGNGNMIQSGAWRDLQDLHTLGRMKPQDGSNSRRIYAVNHFAKSTCVNLQGQGADEKAKSQKTTGCGSAPDGGRKQRCDYRVTELTVAA
jgi:hypothetical protein